MPTGAEILLDVTDLRQSRKNYLRKRVYQGMSKDEFNKQMRTEYSELAESYPTIFEKVMAGDLEDVDARRQLESMLNMKDRVDNGNVPEFDASTQVGNQLFDKYVKPTLSDPPK